MFRTALKFVTRINVTSVVDVAGLASITYGAHQIYVPATYIVPGVVVMAWSYLAAKAAK